MEHLADYACNVKPGDFEPEPNWRQLYEATHEQKAILIAKIAEQAKEIEALKDRIDDILLDYME